MSKPHHLYKFLHHGKARWGVPIQDLSYSLASLQQRTNAMPPPDIFHPVSNQDEFEQNPVDTIVRIDRQQELKAERLLAPIGPVVSPSVYVIGLNYSNHIKETGFPAPRHPVIVMKNPATVTGPFDPIRIPSVCSHDEVDFEVELAIVIGKPARDVSTKQALNYIAGYTCANDVSARKWQGKRGGGQWVRAKSFDTFCPLGPCLTTHGVGFDPNDVKLGSVISGEQMQDSTTNDMLFNVQELVSFLSQGTTLLPWTVILTGTPEGVGYTRDPPRLLQHGDEAYHYIENIGAICNPVEREDHARL